MPVPRGAAGSALLAALTVAAVSMSSCRTSPPREDIVYVYPLERQVELLNAAVYPEGSYRVLPGDTPRGVAARLGVDFEVFAAANGLDEGGKLKTGDLLIVPRVALRRETLIGTGGEVAAPKKAPPGAPESPETPPVDPAGTVRAVSAGKVTAVFRGYISLGDVVIIENDNERIVYSGSFEPAVEKGEIVSVGDVIATGAAAGSVKARVFEK